MAETPTTEDFMAGHIEALETQLARLTAERDALLAALKLVEWIDDLDDSGFSKGEYCPWCCSYERGTHKDNCDIAAAIALTEKPCD